MTAARTMIEPLIRWREERSLDRVWHVVAHVLLAISTVLAVVRAGVGWESRAVTVLLAVMVAGWTWLMVQRHPQWTERWLAPMALYYAVLLGLTLVLLLRDPAYQLFVGACFPLAFVTLPRWSAYVGVALAALLIPASSLADSERPSWNAGSIILVVLFVSVIGAVIRTMEAIARERREANHTLAAANVRLAELAEENAELQARLLDRAREFGAGAERARLARELHDTVAQDLAGIVTQLEAADEFLETAEPGHPVRDRLGTAIRLARDGLGDARRSVQALRPAELENGRLPEVITATVDAWRAHHGEVAFTVTGTPIRLHPEVEITLLRVAQEALANVARHADASRVGVTLSYLDDMVILDVRDDGQGFDPAGGTGASESTGFGLTAMRQRVRRLAGTVELETGPGRGTAISVTVPALAPGGPDLDGSDRDGPDSDRTGDGDG